MLISIDTYLSEVAEFAIDLGADIINDISGRIRSKMLDVVSKHQIAYVLMHMQGTPQNMQLNPTYENVVKDIRRFL
jgi:dihydropteroate synthase